VDLSGFGYITHFSDFSQQKKKKENIFVMNGAASCPCCRASLMDAASSHSNVNPSFLCEPCNIINKFDLRSGVKMGGGDGMRSKMTIKSSLGIWMAAANGDLERVRHHVVKRGVSPNILDAYGNSPLHKACFDDHVQVVLFLLAAGANPDENGSGATPLLRCAAWSSLKSLQVLLEGGANIHAIDTSFQDERTALHKACDVGNETACKILLAFGARTDVLDSRGDTPLQVAIHTGNVNCVQLLWKLEHNCSVPELVQLAVSSGQREVLDMLQQTEDSAIVTNEDTKRCKEQRERLEKERVALAKADHDASMRMQVQLLAAAHTTISTQTPAVTIASVLPVDVEEVTEVLQFSILRPRRRRG
jgi:hypothetical protein